MEVLYLKINNTQITTSSLGENLVAYLGKSMYSGDGYFKGAFDNFKVYNRVLSDSEITENVIDKVSLLKSAVIGTTPQDPSTTMGTDDHTAISSKIDTDTKEITSYVKKTANRAAIPVTLNLLTKDVTATVNGQPFGQWKQSRSDKGCSRYSYFSRQNRNLYDQNTGTCRKCSPSGTVCRS